MKNISIRIAFAAMAMTYCLGAFNDNFFKQAAMLLAVDAGLSRLQGYATVLFSLPFILFSAYGGWCADVFPKKKVIVAVKALEVFAMIVGAVGLLTENWILILAMVFLMGLQSTFFSPALNGSIPEMYDVSEVPRVNAILKLATTLAILLGIALAGISLDQKWVTESNLPNFDGHQVAFGVWLVAGIALFVAIIGFLASFALAKRDAAGGTNSFPWSGPLRSITDCLDISKDRQLMLGIICDSWFYFISVLAVQLINTLGLSQFGFSQSRTSLLSVSLMLGICIGSFIAAKLTTAETWNRYLQRSSCGMGICLALTGIAPLIPESLRFPYLVVSLAAAGCAGGIFIIPTATVLQIRPKDTEKGRVLSAASFCSFIAILLAGVIFSCVDGMCSPAVLMVITGIAGILFASFLGILIAITRCVDGQPLPHSIRRFFAVLLNRLLSLRYRVEEHGFETMLQDLKERNVGDSKKAGILFLPNHPALIDPVLITSRLLADFAPRPLVDSMQLDNLFSAFCVDAVRPIIIPDSRRDGITARKKILYGMQAVVTALKNGENVLFYPAGRLNRQPMESLGTNSGVEYIVKKVPDIQIVLIRSHGLWGSSFSYANEKPSLFRHWQRYLAALVAGGLFFMPKRTVRIDFYHDKKCAAMQGKDEINRHLEQFYNELPVSNQHVPLITPIF